MLTCFTTHVPCNADLPSELQRRVLAELDPPDHLALFCGSLPLARMVLLHAPSSKILTVDIASSEPPWSPALARVFGGVSLRPLTDLDLHVRSAAASPPQDLPSHPPPQPLMRRVTHLRLSGLNVLPASLALWRLPTTKLWPHLQHLTLHKCPLPPAPKLAQALQPIPRLLSFTWEQATSAIIDSKASQLAVLRLAAHATHLHVLSSQPDNRPCREMALRALAQLRRLTHAHLDVAGDDEVVEALLRHPTLEHVTLLSLHHDDGGFLENCSQRLCRWRTLTATDGASLAILDSLPLAGLERLTICGRLQGVAFDAYEDTDPYDQAGLAALQRLHSQGRLALRKGTTQNERWQLSREEGLFEMLDLGNLVPAVLRLVLEAGQGITALQVEATCLLERELIDDLALLEVQHAGINTLCVYVGRVGVGLWWRDALVLLPECITHLKAGSFPARTHFMGAVEARKNMRDLVEGGVAALMRPVTLTLLHNGLIDPNLGADLVALCVGVPPGQGDVDASGGDGDAGGEQPGPFLTLRVARSE